MWISTKHSGYGLFKKTTALLLAKVIVIQYVITVLYLDSISKIALGTIQCGTMVIKQQKKKIDKKSGMRDDYVIM